MLRRDLGEHLDSLLPGGLGPSFDIPLRVQYRCVSGLLQPCVCRSGVCVPLVVHLCACGAGVWVICAPLCMMCVATSFVFQFAESVAVPPKL